MVLNAAVFIGIDGIIWFLRVPGSITGLMKDYLLIIFAGIIGTFLYNYFACLLRSVGNSRAPLLFLAVSAVMNIVLDLVFVVIFRWGVGVLPLPPSSPSTYPAPGWPSTQKSAFRS